MPGMNQIRLGYTASPKYSFVYNANHFENINEYQDHTIGMNFLLKRWLNHDSQANLYAGIHGGIYKNSFPMEMSDIYFLWETGSLEFTTRCLRQKDSSTMEKQDKTSRHAMVLHHLSLG